jgi:hypothetical protein
MTTIDPKSLDELVKLLDRCSGPESKPGDYVSFVDEDNPDAGVQFCRKDGHAFMWMPTEDYEAILKSIPLRVEEEPYETD